MRMRVNETNLWHISMECGTLFIHFLSEGTLSFGELIRSPSYIS